MSQLIREVCVPNPNCDHWPCDQPLEFWSAQSLSCRALVFELTTKLLMSKGRARFFPIPKLVTDLAVVLVMVSLGGYPWMTRQCAVCAFLALVFSLLAPLLSWFASTKASWSSQVDHDRLKSGRGGWCSVQWLGIREWWFIPTLGVTGST